MLRITLIFCQILLLGPPAILGTFDRQPNVCGEPVAIEHGSVLILGTGTHVTYQCQPGFFIYGTLTIRCQGDGQWSEKPPICVAPGCSPLPQFIHGRSAIRMNGAVVLYRCPKGSWITGSKTIFCDGTRWNDTVPTCQVRQMPDFLPISNCPLPPKVQDAVAVKMPEYVAYTCVNRTVSTVGSNILRCLSSGQWDRDPVICARPGCHQLSEPVSGLIIGKYGFAVVEFRCFLHHHLIGSKVLFCNGQRWNGTVPSCVRDIPLTAKPTTAPEEPSVAITIQDGTSCGQAPRVGHGMPSYSTELDSQGATYWSVQYDCDVGYRLLRSGRLFCSRGVWVGEHLQCVAYCGVNNGGCSHYCINTNGHATCTCRSGYRLHINGRSCNDVNECASNSGRGPCSEICHNYDGSYSCRCQRGYHLRADGHTCTAQIVDPCSRIRCSYGSCIVVNGKAICQCPRGLTLSRDMRTCQDINECSRQVSPCEHACQNTFGGYECTCPQGSARTAGGQCEDCGVNTYLSPNGRRCIPCPDGSATRGPGHISVAACMCKKGFEGNPETGRPCRDINECSTHNGGCEHSCANIKGSYFCKCRPGYTLDLENQQSCIEIDECALNNGGCLHECRNSPGSFACICSEGYAIDPFDRYTCMDVDECSFDSSRCEQVCVNFVGGFRCECNAGFRLNKDRRTCTAEICAPLLSPQHGQVNETCSLSQAGHGLPVGKTCEYQCDKGYWLDGEPERRCNSNGQWSGMTPSCVNIQCPKLVPPEFGQVIPERCQLTPSEFRSFCGFSCDSGYNLLGHSMMKCLGNGEWSRRAPICSRDTQIRCPIDVTSTLPPRSSQMAIDLPEADHTLDFVNSTHPLTGHVFQAGLTEVTFTAYTNDTRTQVSCTMNVNVRDVEAPQLVECPSPFTMKVQERYVTSLDVPQPVFRDNVAVTNVSRVLPSGRITWGTYTVHYIARDRAGNTATCTFAITIQPLSLDCGVLDGPLNGNHFCNPWMYGQMCQPTCMPGFYYFDGPLPRPTYICGRDAHWNPAKKVPDCTAFELVGNTSVPCAGGKQLKDHPALGGLACMDCPRGMYSAELGPDAQPVCKQCPRGLYQDRTGQISCLVCPGGTTTSFQGATSARECESSIPAAVTEPPL